MFRLQFQILRRKTRVGRRANAVDKRYHAFNSSSKAQSRLASTRTDRSMLRVLSFFRDKFKVCADLHVDLNRNWDCKVKGVSRAFFISYPLPYC